MADYFLDSNILIAYAKPDSPEYPIVSRAIRKLRHERHMLLISSQTVTEFWSVVTRPGPRGLSWSAANASKTLNDYMSSVFEFKPDPPSLHDDWLELCQTHNITGAHCYDARISALMKSYAVNAILTFNIKHFVLFPNIQAVDPASI